MNSHRNGASRSSSTTGPAPAAISLPHAVEKQIKLLGVASLERVPVAPDLRTLHEQGITGFDVDLWFGLLAPAGTPGDIIARYNAAMNEFLLTPKMVAELGRQGLHASGGAPEVLRDLIARDVTKWQKIVRDAGITAE
jgi:tripartite-type tricarboxylate transporter receptor subunit TctC